MNDNKQRFIDFIETHWRAAPDTEHGRQRRADLLRFAEHHGIAERIDIRPPAPERREARGWLP